MYLQRVTRQRAGLLTTRSFRFMAPVLLMLAAVGCASVPEKLQETISSFDGAREIALPPVLVCRDRSGDGFFMKLGLFRRSTMNPHSVILVVAVNKEVPIADGESLRFRADGWETMLSPIDDRTQFGIGTGPHKAGAALDEMEDCCSIRRYMVDSDLLKELIRSKEALVRVSMDRITMECPLVSDHPDSVLAHFRMFYEREYGVVK